MLILKYFKTPYQSLFRNPNWGKGDIQFSWSEKNEAKATLNPFELQHLELHDVPNEYHSTRKWTN